MLLTRKVHFCASHRYHNPALSDEENREIFGKCNLPHGHGHNYILEVTVKGKVDPQTGMVVNLKDLDVIIKEVVMANLDHKNLNVDVEAFHNTIPTSENIVAWIWERVAPKVAPYGELYRLRLHEDPTLSVDYFGGVEAPAAFAE